MVQNPRVGNKKILPKGRRTDREIFLETLGKQTNDGQNIVNNKTFMASLSWSDEKFKRIKGQLLNEEQIIVTRGGPGGAVGLPGSKKDSVQLFISYCHADEGRKIELCKHLLPLKQLSLITDWHDRKIVPGQDWAQEISHNLDSSKIILFLVSIDFINSKYCYGVEMERALELREEKGALVIPVILRDCMWQHTPFGAFQALPKDGKPVAAAVSEDTALVEVVQGIKNAVDKLLSAM